MQTAPHLVLGLVVFLFGCGDRPAPPAAPAPAPGLDGALLYRQNSCDVCHGDDRAGSDNAPPLRGLAAHWDAERLTVYLADPAPVVASDPRLSELGERYEVEMLAYGHVPESERRALAEWLLVD